MIRKEGFKYHVLSEDGSKKLGTYATREEAERRLREIEMFKKMKAAGKPQK